jgi:hypothetical protein
MKKELKFFCRALWTVKVNFIIKKFGATELNYIDVQEIDPKRGREGGHCEILSQKRS